MSLLRILSDLHLEFHADRGRAFVESLARIPGETVVLAGDVCSAAGLLGALSLLCRKFEETDVVYVVGNHEFYGSSREGVGRALARAEREHSNLHVLDKDIFELKGGARLLGCPLWFPRNDGAPWQAMNDFYQIKGFASWVYEENARCAEFLRRHMREGDVVLTHYLPARGSVAPRWQGSPLNPFFLCDLEPLIVEKKPALWIHGHTHDSCDYRVGETRVVCNPFGYIGHEVNPRFDPNFRIHLVG